MNRSLIQENVFRHKGKHPNKRERESEYWMLNRPYSTFFHKTVGPEKKGFVEDKTKDKRPSGLNYFFLFLFSFGRYWSIEKNFFIFMIIVWEVDVDVHLFRTVLVDPIDIV